MSTSKQYRIVSVPVGIEAALNRHLAMTQDQLRKVFASYPTFTITAGAANDTLRYDGTAWVNNSFLTNTGTAVFVGGERNAQVKWSTAAPSGTPPDGTIWVQY